MPRHGERIYKRKDGRWEARYVKSIEENGKKRYGSVYAKTYREVKEKQNSCGCISALPQKAALPVNIEGAANEWLMYCRGRIKDSTYQKYETILKKHIIPHLGKLSADLLTKEALRNFTEALLQKNLAKSTVNNVLVVLSVALRFAREEYGVPCPKVQLLKLEKRNMRVLSRAEYQRLTQYALKNESCWSLGILLALFTGMRIGEICALQWSDIADGMIQVSKTMQRMKGGEKTAVVITSPKTETSKRQIPLPRELIPIIERYRDQRLYVVCQANGKYIEPRLLQVHFSQILVLCSIPPANFHSLRHTFATRCMEAGMDVKTLSEILGHTDVKITLNRYTHSSVERKQQQMNLLRLNGDME